MTSLGVIGTGQFALYFITALRKGGYAGQITVSPRNAAIAARLAREHCCQIALSNQDVLDRSEVVLLSVRPKDLANAVSGLGWRPGHTALSAVAGISLEQHRRLLPGIGAVHLIMPASYIATVPGPVPLYPPSEKMAAFLAHAGQVVPLDTEEGFVSALFAVCFSTWIYARLRRALARGPGADFKNLTSRYRGPMTSAPEARPTTTIVARPRNKPVVMTPRVAFSRASSAAGSGRSAMAQSAM